MEINEYDVFSFRYHPNKAGDNHDYYRCFDGQLVAKKNQEGGIYPEDTYWSSQGQTFTPKEAEKRGVLKFRFNLNDVERIGRPDIKYYDPMDVFNFSSQHNCYQRWVLKKGAKRNQATMLSNIAQEIEQVRRDLSYARRNLEVLLEREQQIKDGNIELYF